MSLSFLLSLTVLLPCTIGLIRFGKIPTSYRPFIVLMLAGLLSELASGYCIYKFNSNVWVVNVFFLCECLLIFYQFYVWRFNSKPRNWFSIVIALAVTGWIIENIVFYEPVKFSPIFHISYSFLIVMLSIIEINYLITHERRQLFKNARFLICLVFVFFFLYQILLEWAYIVAAKEKEIAQTILGYQSYINALTNIIYAVAILYIPVKRFDFDRTLESIKEQQRKSGAKSPSSR